MVTSPFHWRASIMSSGWRCERTSSMCWKLVSWYNLALMCSDMTRRSRWLMFANLSYCRCWYVYVTAVYFYFFFDSSALVLLWCYVLVPAIILQLLLVTAVTTKVTQSPFTARTFVIPYVVKINRCRLEILQSKISLQFSISSWTETKKTAKGPIKETFENHSTVLYHFDDMVPW